MKNENSILNQLISKQTDIPDENFFEEMATTILADNKHSIKIIPLYKKPIFRWLSAAAVLIPIFIYIGLNTQKQHRNNELATINTLSNEDINTYLIEERKVIPAEKQRALPTSEKIKNPQIAQQTTIFKVDPFESLENEDIKAYLLFESIEPEDDEADTFI